LSKVNKNEGNKIRLVNIAKKSVIETNKPKATVPPKSEAVKIDNGTSNLTNPNQAQIHGGGMGLGEVLLSSIAGAMIGSYIGNKLFNNSNYQSQRRANYKSPSTYSKSVNSFKKAKTSSARKTTSSKRSGFFGGGSRTSGKRSFFGG